MPTTPLRFLTTSFLLWALAGLPGCTQPAAPSLRLEERKTAAGRRYQLFYPQNLAVRVVTRRPDAGNGYYQLAVAAAYTDLATNQPLDLLVDNGQVRQATAKQGFLDGVLTILDTTLTITRIPGGQSPPGAQVEEVRRQKGTLLLQELVVFQGRNQKQVGGSLFQRRALVEFANHQFALIEGTADDCTMHQLGADLVELGARNALYLDMGDWDEGWYRQGKQVTVLGHRRTETARQSNWLVFVQPAAANLPK